MICLKPFQGDIPYSDAIFFKHPTRVFEYIGIIFERPRKQICGTWQINAMPARKATSRKTLANENIFILSYIQKCAAENQLKLFF